MSQRGPGFRAANGSPIKHYGQRTLKGLGDQYQSLSMTAQVADVKTTLGSVNQMLKAGSRIHFETESYYAEDTCTGKKVKNDEKGGAFEVEIWVPMPGDHRQGKRAVNIKGNPKTNFQRQGEEPRISL